MLTRGRRSHVPQSGFTTSACCHHFWAGKWLLTCRQMARLTLQPKEVLTARGCRPRSLKSLEKDWVSAMRGRSSATTTHVRTRDRSSPRACREGSGRVSADQVGTHPECQRNSERCPWCPTNCDVGAETSSGDVLGECVRARGLGVPCGSVDTQDTCRGQG